MKMKHYALARQAMSFAFQYNHRGESGRAAVLEYVMKKEALSDQPFDFEYSEEDRALVARYMGFTESKINQYRTPDCCDPESPSDALTGRQSAMTGAAREANGLTAAPWSEESLDAAREAAKTINSRKSAVELLRDSNAVSTVLGGFIETRFWGHRATIDLSAGTLTIHDDP